MRLRSALDQVAINAQVARGLFVRANGEANDPLLAQYRAECDKAIGVWATFAQLVQAMHQYQEALKPGVNRDQIKEYLTRVGEIIDQARERLVGVIADLEQVKAPYLRPQILRDLSVPLAYIEQWQRELSDLAADLAAGHLKALPEFSRLSCNQLDLDPFVSSHANL
jgi:hypothetical protein